MRTATVRHDALIEAAVTEHGGVVVRPRAQQQPQAAASAWPAAPSNGTVPSPC